MLSATIVRKLDILISCSPRIMGGEGSFLIQFCTRYLQLLPTRLSTFQEASVMSSLSIVPSEVNYMGNEDLV